MDNRKTYFEQVPLTVVKQIIEKQDQAETTKNHPEIKKEKQVKVRPEAKRQSIALPLTVMQARL